MSARDETTYYEVLGVARDASAAEIRRAFQRLTLEHHPDRNRNDPSAGARMAAINAAYRVLRDRQKRQEYDASLPAQVEPAAEDTTDSPFREARTRWEQADAEQQEWQQYVREVQVELQARTDSDLRSFVRMHSALADYSTSFEERSMHQWFAAIALEEVEAREERARRERAERERRRAERERRQRRERERAEQERREQHRRDAQRSEVPSQPNDEPIVSHTDEPRSERNAGRIIRRLAARVGVAVAVIVAQTIALALLDGTDPDNPASASDGTAIAAIIWFLCGVLVLGLAGFDAFEKGSVRMRKGWAWVIGALFVLSIVISATVG